jgi:HAD superfamily hydrolase (TIGR01509 family)
MRKLVIFDLDGVLIDSRELHYEALNRALEQVDPRLVITKEEHLSKYDGLPTKEKLKMLARTKGLSAEYFDKIADLKQEYTLDLLTEKVYDTKVQNYFQLLKDNGYAIAVASNAVRSTVRISLYQLGVLHLVDHFVSNEDVQYNKPYPEMYWQCMLAVKALPQHTVIFEDSHIGREGATNSGAYLIPVADCNDLDIDKINDAIEYLEKVAPETKIKWRDKRLNVVIPMAGAGSRFQAAGYTFPKPLIEVNGKPMIQVVVENLNVDAHFIFIVQKEHYDKYNLKYLLELIAPGCDIVQIDGITEGAALTVLMADPFINNNDPLLIANSDQFVEWNSNEALYAFTAEGVDAGILTFEATHPKWSYAKLGPDGFVSEVAEKKVISNEATVGIYYWKRGKDFVASANEMIQNDDRTNGEFYVCPAFNWAIRDGKKVRVKRVKAMWGIGTPEDLNYFLNHYKG